MARADAIKVAGVVVETWPNGTCQVALANGHQVLAWGAKRAGLARPAPGNKVWLELSPCDLSRGRLVVENEELKHESSGISQKALRKLQDH